MWDKCQNLHRTGQTGCPHGQWRELLGHEPHKGMLVFNGTLERQKFQNNPPRIFK
jgi:hypothetical protein